MEEIINAIINNGVAIGVLIYFIYRDSTFMTTLTKSLQELTDTIKSLQDKIDGMEGRK